MITEARYTDTTSIQIEATLDTGVKLGLPSYPSDTHWDQDMALFLDNGGVIDLAPTDLPPLDMADSGPAYSVMVQGAEIEAADKNRRSVGATPIIADADQAEWNAWMADTYNAVDSGSDAAEPPVFVRQAIAMPGDNSGQCVISWKEFGGGWPGWGFEAIFDRADITALGLKVYDENGGYLYALTFQKVPNEHNRWSTETPAGFATPTKAQRSFEIIAGSAPVTDFKTLTDQIDYLSLLVRWQPA